MQHGLFFGTRYGSLVEKEDIDVRLPDLSNYFITQFISHLKKDAGVEAETGLSTLKHRFVVRVSETYFNRNDNQISQKFAKRKMLKSFFKDIQKDPIIADSPSRIKRCLRFDAGTSESSPATKRRKDQTCKLSEWTACTTCKSETRRRGSM
jgi:hypothetical protein